MKIKFTWEMTSKLIARKIFEERGHASGYRNVPILTLKDPKEVGGTSQMNGFTADLEFLGTGTESATKVGSRDYPFCEFVFSLIKRRSFVTDSLCDSLFGSL